MNGLKIALCQINPTVGDLDGNTKIIQKYLEYHSANDVIVFPELALIGYPPEDLVHNKAFQVSHNKKLEEIISYTKGKLYYMLLSTAYQLDGSLYNCVLVITNGKIIQILPKVHLPNYSVFDEKRLFVKGESADPVEIRGVKLGVMTCEDLWFPDVSQQLSDKGAEILLAINSSPYDIEKRDLRNKIVFVRNQETNLPVIYLNMVGGQDELAFDGLSFIMNKEGQIIHKMKAWSEDSLEIVVGNKIEIVSDKKNKYQEESKECQIYSALTLGLRDYTRKNGFEKVLLGLSGGIDSALTAAIAVDALGADKVHCVRLPSMYSSDHSLTDAEELAKNLSIILDTVAIEPIYQSIESSLSSLFNNLPQDVTEENIQARIRGLVLMAISNKFNNLLLTTGNKSEVAVGYSTLYGDMCGGFSLLKDIYKTTVFNLSRWRNICYTNASCKNITCCRSN